MNRWHSLLGAVLVVVSAGTRLANADSAFDNLGAPPYTVDGYASFGLLDGVYYDRGEQFTATNSLYLSSLQLAIGQAYYDGTTLPGPAQVQLLTDNNNTPATVLETWTTATQNSYSGGVVTLPSTSPLPITAGTNYWIMLSAAPGSSLGGEWFFADDQHTGSTLTDVVVVATGTSYYTPLTRGFQGLVSGSPFLLGDANLDGTVNAADLRIVLNNLGTTTSLRADGNFDGAATIDLTDLDDVLNNLGTSVPAASLAAVVATPEPASIAALALAVPLLFRNRSRREPRRPHH